MSWFHVHKWRVAGVTPMTRVKRGYFLDGHWFSLGHPLTTHYTVVLFRCECSAVKTQDLDGVWTLEDMNAPISDTQFLKQAGVKL